MLFNKFMKRGPSPFNEFQTENNNSKKQIEKFISNCQSELKKNIKDFTKLFVYYENGLKFEEELVSLKTKLNSLVKENEHNPSSKFDEQKFNELKKIEFLQLKINPIIDQLKDIQEREKNKTVGENKTNIDIQKLKNSDGTFKESITQIAETIANIAKESLKDREHKVIKDLKNNKEIENDDNEIITDEEEDTNSESLNNPDRHVDNKDSIEKQTIADVSLIDNKDNDDKQSKIIESPTTSLHQTNLKDNIDSIENHNIKKVKKKVDFDYSANFNLSKQNESDQEKEGKPLDREPVKSVEKANIFPLEPNIITEDVPSTIVKKAILKESKKIEENNTSTDDEDEYTDVTVTEEEDGNDNIDTNYYLKDKSEVRQDKFQKKALTNELSTDQKFEFIAVESFEAQQNGDLSFKKGEIIHLLESKRDGWVKAVNKSGIKGLVPMNFLKSLDYQSKTGIKLIQSSKIEQGSNQDISSDDQQISEVEDNDSLSDNIIQNEEPLEKNQEINQSQESNELSRSGHELWSGIREALKESSRVNDVLEAIGAMPASFRQSTLSQLEQLEQFSMKYQLFPKLNASCLSHRDIFFDYQTNQLKGIKCTIQKIVNLVSVKNIPHFKEDSGLVIINRHARICLFDGQQILSNIIFVKCCQIDKEQRVWDFKSKQETPCIEFSEIFIRSSSVTLNIGILIELAMTYKKLKTNEVYEISCGWAFFKLFDQSGILINNRTCEEIINGGTPFDKGIPLNTVLPLTKTANLLRNLLNNQMVPICVIRITNPTKEQNDLLESLPELIISKTIYIQYLSFYRQILADILLKDRITPQSTEILFSPILCTLPDVIEQPDLIDILRIFWVNSLKSFKRTNKKNLETLRQLFQKVYMDSIYPYLYLATLPKLIQYNPYNVEDRLMELRRATNSNYSTFLSNGLNLFNKPDLFYLPFDTTQLTFDLLSSNCVDVVD